MTFRSSVASYVYVPWKQSTPIQENASAWINSLLSNLQDSIHECYDLIEDFFSGKGMSFSDWLCVDCDKKEAMVYIYFYPSLEREREYQSVPDEEENQERFLKWLLPEERLKTPRENIIEILQDWKQILFHRPLYPFIFIWEDPITKWIRIKPCASEIEIDESIKKYGLN
jgi:hypothetical protein